MRRRQKRAQTIELVSSPLQPTEPLHEGTLKTKCVWGSGAEHAGSIIACKELPLLRQPDITFTHEVGDRERPLKLSLNINAEESLREYISVSCKNKKKAF